MKQILTAICLLLLVTNAKAGIIASNPLDFDVPWFGWFSDTTRTEVANEFSIINAAIGTSLTWWGGELSSRPDHEFIFDIRFYRDAGDLPEEAPFFAFTTALLTGNFVGTDIYGPPENSFTALSPTYRYQTDIPGAEFEGPGSYWLSISAHADSQFIWSHASPASDVGVYRNIRDGESFWSSFDFGERNNNAFILEGIGGTLPLPATWALLLPAVLLMLKRRS
jgi:hypothetical protein